MLQIPDAQRALGNMSRSTLYRELSAGRLAAIHRGRSVYITAASIVDYVERLQESA